MLLQSHETETAPAPAPAPASMRGPPPGSRRTGRQGERQEEEVEEEEEEVFVVHLLPALPGDEVPDGRVDGLVARGGFVVRELVWAGGKFARASVLAQNGGMFKVKVQGRDRGFAVDGVSYDPERGVETTVGGVYEITPL
ncbi:hypothetical protein L209DRAFT_752132, partial [Thermothelomyces heterothallicus CBS 203.75]